MPARVRRSLDGENARVPLLSSTVSHLFLHLFLQLDRPETIIELNCLQIVRWMLTVQAVWRRWEEADIAESLV
jgi:hypothetical protein